MCIGYSIGAQFGANNEIEDESRCSIALNTIRKHEAKRSLGQIPTTYKVRAKKRSFKFSITLESHPIPNLGAIHSQRAIVIEHEPVKAQEATYGQWCHIESLRTGVNIDDNAAGIRQNRRLTALRGKSREQVVVRQRNGISREAARTPDCCHCAVDSLRQERNCRHRNESWAIGECVRMRAEINALSGNHVVGSEGCRKWQARQIAELRRRLVNGVRAEA